MFIAHALKFCLLSVGLIGLAALIALGIKAYHIGDDVQTIMMGIKTLLVIGCLYLVLKLP